MTGYNAISCGGKSTGVYFDIILFVDFFITF